MTARHILVVSGAAVLLFALTYATAASVGATPYLAEVTVLHWDAWPLTLLFVDDRLVQFQVVEAPAPDGPRRAPTGSRQVAGDQVLPGGGALGIRFGDSRESVASRLGHPVASHGFAVPQHPSGVDYYRASQGYVWVVVNSGQVTEIAGHGLLFRSPLGFRYGMRLADVRRVLGPPQQEQTRSFYRVAARGFQGTTLLAIVIGVLGGALSAALARLVRFERNHWPYHVTAGLFVWLSCYWAGPAPLLPDGFYALESGPVFGGLSWALPWLAAACATELVFLYRRARVGVPRGSERLLGLLAVVAAGTLGGFCGSAMLGLLLRVYGKMNPGQVQLTGFSHPIVAPLAVALLGAVTALVCCPVRWSAPASVR